MSEKILPKPEKVKKPKKVKIVVTKKRYFLPFYERTVEAGSIREAVEICKGDM